jgi:hypothetical protein
MTTKPLKKSRRPAQMKAAPNIEIEWQNSNGTGGKEPDPGMLRELARLLGKLAAVRDLKAKPDTLFANLDNDDDARQ